MTKLCNGPKLEKPSMLKSSCQEHGLESNDENTNHGGRVEGVESGALARIGGQG